MEDRFRDEVALITDMEKTFVKDQNRAGVAVDWSCVHPRSQNVLDPSDCPVLCGIDQHDAHVRITDRRAVTPSTTDEKSVPIMQDGGARSTDAELRVPGSFTGLFVGRATHTSAFRRTSAIQSDTDGEQYEPGEEAPGGST